MNIQQNVDLAPYNSFKVSCRCRYYVEIGKLEDLQQALDFAALRGLEFLLLGGGSNILLTADYEGLVLHIKTTGIEILEQIDEDKVLVKAAAGENWHCLVSHCLDQGLHGLENLALIPGTVGAAPIQNIGAYGVELEQFLVQVSAYDIARQKVVKIDKQACDFAYRDSVFKRELRNKMVILDVTLRLSRSTSTITNYQALQQRLEHKLGHAGAVLANPRQVFDAVCHIRRSKLPDPAVLGNAGSFFKNPIISNSQMQQLRNQFPELPIYTTDVSDKVKIPAAWLLEQAGWKGRQYGAVAVHKDQALVIVNCGQGSGSEILSLAKQMQESVRALFRLELEIEVRII